MLVQELIRKLACVTVATALLGLWFKECENLNCQEADFCLFVCFTKH